MGRLKTYTFFILNKTYVIIYYMNELSHIQCGTLVNDISWGLYPHKDTQAQTMHGMFCPCDSVRGQPDRPPHLTNYQNGQQLQRSTGRHVHDPETG